MNEKIEKAFNDQINVELHSAYLYQAMAAYFSEQNLNGMATWMFAQAQEEMIHAGKFYQHVLDRGGHIKFSGIDAVPDSWESPAAAFEAAYKHEQYITGRIHALMDLAISEKDYGSKPLLDWFVDEQIEEEATADESVQKAKMVGNSGQGLYLLDQELGQRATPFTLTAPSDK